MNPRRLRIQATSGRATQTDAAYEIKPGYGSLFNVAFSTTLRLVRPTKVYSVHEGTGNKETMRKM